MILIIEFYQTLFFLSFNHIFLYFIGAFDVFSFSFSRWNDNLSYTTISVTKLDGISKLGIELGIDLLGHACSSAVTLIWSQISSLFLRQLLKTKLELLRHSCSMWWGLSLHQWGSNSVLKVVGTLPQL